jgi:DNA (cytosine-5)-methyltransferase 1
VRFGSLFSGIGGFDLGFEQAGLTCEWQVEIDKDCSRVLENRFRDVRRFADVNDVGKLPAVDVICGGFPCQDLSVAGKRAGLAGERSGLWFQFLRIIESNLPRWIVIENVPGLLSSDEGRDFAAILRGLVECGYCLAWRILDAQYAGVAQRRRRVFIVGSLGNGSCAEILFESESVSWNPPTRGESGPGVAASVKASAPNRRNGGSDPIGDEFVIAGTYQNTGHGWWNESPTAQTIRTPEGGGSMEANVVTHALRSEGADASEDGTGRGTPLVVAEAVDVRNLRMQPDGTSGTLQHKKSGGYSLNYQNPIMAFTLHGSDKTVNTATETDIAGSVRTKAPGSIENSSTTIVAFSSKDHGADAGEISPTLRAQNFKDSHINGGGQIAIAFAENQRGEVRTANITPQLSCSGGKPGSGYSAVAFHENKSGQLSEADVLGVRAGASHSYQGVGGAFGVRRLTPRECERLQGFPDDWTLYDSEGKEISDSARYRMLGNAVAVPVAKWIGARLRMSSDEQP